MPGWPWVFGCLPSLRVGLCTLFLLDFGYKNMAFMIMFFCLPVTFLLFLYISIICYVISPLLFVLNSLDSSVCCLSLHCLDPVLGPGLSHLSFTWTLMSQSARGPAHPQALLLQGR